MAVSEGAGVAGISPVSAQDPGQVGGYRILGVLGAVVALAELAGTILLTGDERITAAPALRCEIRIVK